MTASAIRSMRLGTLLIALLFTIGCGASIHENRDKIKVVASFYPMYDFARNVGGDRIDASTLIPAGIEPHEYEPAPSDIRSLSQARVFILNGANEEAWAPNLISGLDNKDLIVADTSKGIALMNSEDADSPGYDPHIWLDPALAKLQVAAIRDALVQVDPDGKSYYERNAAAYTAELDKLDSEFRAAFADCRQKDILITHATLAYFCREYGCRQVPLEGVNAEGDPSPAALAEIIRKSRENNITTVFVENLVNPKSAETIADEIHGKVAVFNTVHGLTAEELKRGENYITQMDRNVMTIKDSLDCGRG